jgi:hypothetical protein
MLDGHEHHAQPAATGGYDPPAKANAASDDPFLAWLARVPVGRPLSALARSRIPEAEARSGRTAPVLSTEDLMTAARALRGK